MKLFRALSLVYVAVILVNLLGCAEEHHTEVMKETVVEQQEVVE